MKVGRPTKYTDKFIDEAKNYITSFNNSDKDFPTIEGLALKLGVDDERIGEWSKLTDKKGNLLHPEFNATIKDLKHKQKLKLMKDGMYGGKDVNSTMAIFLLKVNHGMIETEKKILAGDKNSDPIQVEIIEDTIKNEA